MTDLTIWENKPDADGGLPECQFFVSMEQPACLKPAPYAVKARTTAYNEVLIDLCDEHMNSHREGLIRRATNNRRAAQARLEQKQAKIK